MIRDKERCSGLQKETQEDERDKNVQVGEERGREASNTVNRSVPLRGGHSNKDFEAHSVSWRSMFTWCRGTAGLSFRSVEGLECVAGAEREEGGVQEKDTEGAGRVTPQDSPSWQ